jgi:hypothetical protein
MGILDTHYCYYPTRKTTLLLIGIKLLERQFQNVTYESIETGADPVVTANLP